MLRAAACLHDCILIVDICQPTVYIKRMKINKTMKISKVLAHNLVVLREKNRLSVIELAEKCKVTRQAIYHLESGDRWISQPLIEAICKVYKIEEHELFQINTTL